MGRGRAKAKQTKVARELKYSSGGTDLERLRAELVGSEAAAAVPDDDDTDDDPYAQYADADTGDDTEDSRRSG